MAGMRCLANLGIYRTRDDPAGRPYGFEEDGIFELGGIGMWRASQRLARTGYLIIAELECRGRADGSPVQGI